MPPGTADRDIVRQQPEGAQALPAYIVDIIVIAIIALSALFAFVRGFLREILSIGAWVAAGVATWFGLPLLRSFGRKYIEIELIADVATGVVIFVVVLVVASIISHFLTRGVRESALGPLDRSLGLLFGVFRGALIVCFALLIFDKFYPPDNRPDWLKDARTLPVVQAGADILRGLVPQAAVAQTQDTAEAVGTQMQKAAEIGQAIQIITNAAGPESGTDSPGSAEDSGYNDADRKAMERALQSVQ
jgi:membrane protein required for colicin V production